MRFRRYAWATLGFNLAVILWGAFVRATGSGAGCGRHWPLCNGEFLPASPATNTLIEFTHRTTSAVALILVVGLFWWSRRLFPVRHPARSAAVWSLGFIVVEALVGAGLVLLELVAGNDSLVRAGYLAVHLLNTFLLLAALALTALWSGESAPGRFLWRGRSAWVLGAGLGGVLVVGMTGAIAALGDTLFPAGSLREGFRADTSPTAHLLVRLRVLHPLLAILTGLYLSLAVWLAGRERPEALESRWARLVPALVLVQFGVGLTNLLLLAPVTLQLLHLLIADLLWVALVLFTVTALAQPAAESALRPHAPVR
jgi:heme A synthase